MIRLAVLPRRVPAFRSILGHRPSLPRNVPGLRKGSSPYAPSKEHSTLSIGLHLAPSSVWLVSHFSTRKDSPPSPPIAGISGEWVPTDEFEGRKSFGLFRCDDCKPNRRWRSAHAFPEYTQDCQGCDEEVHPYLMWENDENNHSSSNDRRDASKPPHDRERCEACRLGVCDAQ